MTLMRLRKRSDRAQWARLRSGDRGASRRLEKKSRIEADVEEQRGKDRQGIPDPVTYDPLCNAGTQRSKSQRKPNT